ncbi:MAG TPA: 2OG-Fe(II) oxygenase [Gammaproteobacteria bacterium]
MIDPSSATPYERIARELAESGWSVCADFLPPAQVAALADELRARWAEGEFHAAGVGSGPRHRLHPDIRGDRVFWLDESARTPAQQPYFAALEALRLAINRELFLGLFDFEGHMALYPPGSFYRRHLDQFAGVAYRKVSVILYLNEDWRAEDGGQLRIYMDDSENAAYIDVVPRGGTLVCFLSGRFPHEVLTAGRERCSVTGWFRIRI